MAIITAAGLTDLYNQRAFNKNGSTVTLKKISETEWLLFGDLAEGDSEGFVTNSQFEFELPPFRPSEEFTQIYLEEVGWEGLDGAINGILDQPLEYFTQAGLDTFFLPPPYVDGMFLSSAVYSSAITYTEDIDEGFLLKELPQDAEWVYFSRVYCANPSEVVVSENLINGTKVVLSIHHDSSSIVMEWQIVGLVTDSEWMDFSSFLDAKMFSIWDSEEEVWVNSSESGYFYLYDPNLIDRLSQNPNLFTKLRMIDWDWT